MRPALSHLPQKRTSQYYVSRAKQQFPAIFDWFYDSSPPNQRSSYTKVSWLFDTAKDTMNNLSSHIVLFANDYRTRRRRGGKGHRISGDTAGIWFQNRRFRSRKLGGWQQNDSFTGHDPNRFLRVMTRPAGLRSGILSKCRGSSSVGSGGALNLTSLVGML